MFRYIIFVFIALLIACDESSSSVNENVDHSIYIQNKTSKKQSLVILLDSDTIFCDTVPIAYISPPVVADTMFSGNNYDSISVYWQDARYTKELFRNFVSILIDLNDQHENVIFISDEEILFL